MSYWYFPSNKDVFDIVACLHDYNYVDQPCYKPVKVGDTVFMLLLLMVKYFTKWKLLKNLILSNK